MFKTNLVDETKILKKKRKRNYNKGDFTWGQVHAENSHFLEQYMSNQINPFCGRNGLILMLEYDDEKTSS